MNSNSTFQYENISETSMKSNEEEFGDSHKANQKLIVQLSAENEMYKQEIHQLQLKNFSMETLQNDLQEVVDSLETSKKQLEASMSSKIHEIEEKNKIKINELTARLNEVEILLLDEKDKNINLQKQLDEANKKLSIPVAAPVNEVSFRNDIPELEEKIQQLVEQLSDKHNDCFRLEEDLRECHKNFSELQELYNNAKERLVEKNEALEATRDELTECRIELENLKVSPADEALKGNSVFAELEDRRQKVFKTMTAYKQGYNDIKRALQVKQNEIKALKAEKAAILTTIRNDTDETIQQNSNLIQKLKDKIFELNLKLENERKRCRLLESQTQPNDDKYQYFITTLEAKKTENEELMGRIESASIQSLIDEEMKCKINEQMRLWRQKALITKAQLKAIECRVEMDDSPIHQELLQIIRQENKINKLEDQKPFSNPLEAEKLKNYNETIKPEKNDFEFYKLKIRNSNDSIDENSSPLRQKLTDLIDFSSPSVNKENHEANINSLDVKNQPQIMHDSNNEKIKQEKKGILKNTNEEQNINMNVLTEATISLSETSQEQQKKNLRFAGDTVDPKPSRKLPKRVTPKYPVIFINQDSTNEKND